MRAIFGLIAIIVLGIVAVNVCSGQERSQRDAYRATVPQYQGGRRIDFNFGFTPYAAPYSQVPYYHPVPQYYAPGYQAVPVVPMYQPPAIQFRTRNGFQFYIPLQKNPHYQKPRSHGHKKGCN